MPVVSTVQTQANFSTSHNRLILGTATEILQSDDLQGLLKIPDNLWIFITEQLSKTTELQLFLEQKIVVFQILPNINYKNGFTNLY